jgi:L-aspartate oxidase
MPYPLPHTAPLMVVLVGSGIAGLYAALKLAEAGQHVTLISKAAVGESNSRYAQGGIAAVLPTNPNDSLEQHVQDTLAAGAGYGNEAAIRSLLAEGYQAVEDLLAYGVPFDADADQGLALTREAAHSTNRILHAGGDATGAVVEARLRQQVDGHPAITCWANTLVSDLLLHQGQVVGVSYLHNTDTPTPASLRPPAPRGVLPAKAVVLATGGTGQLYQHTTNPSIATGDGLAMALRAGLPLADMAFVQFHPTALFGGEGCHFLISEAVRGEGGLLRNALGERFMLAEHPQAELAPRDVVSRGVFKQMLAQAEMPAPLNLPHVWLDVTAWPQGFGDQRFPSIAKVCQQLGLDWQRDYLPVAPAAHYAMGGIPVTPWAQSARRGLWVIGEAACTGLHGANRLASNSLLECLVLARRAAKGIAQASAELTPPPAEAWHALAQEALANLPATVTALPALEATLAKGRQQLQQLMWQHAGLLRTQHGIAVALAWVQGQQAVAKQAHWQQAGGWAGVELVNLLQVAEACLQDCLARPTSAGAHCWASSLPVGKVASTLGH